MLAIVIVLIFALLTQNWLSVTASAHFLQANDVAAYLAMAKAAPHLATGIQYAHAQRLLPHWVIGNISTWSGAPLEKVYAVAVGLCILGILASLFKTLEKIQTPVQIRTLLLSAFVLNPYALRIYLMLPPMISDLIFVLGIALTLQGFASRSLSLVLVGIITGAVGHQNMLLLVPGIIIGILFGRAFSARKLATRWFAILLVVLAEFLILHESGQIALLFSHGPFSNQALLTSLTPWIILQHIVRSLFPLLMPLMFFLASLSFPAFRRRIWTIETLMLFFMIAGLLAGAVLAGPVFQAQSPAGRYEGFALIPSLVLVAWLWGIKENVGNLIPVGFSWGLLWAALGLSSLHHLYTRVGPTTGVQFTIVYLFACAIVAASCLILFRSYQAKNRLTETHG